MLTDKDKSHLHQQLIKCGDLLADGDLDPAFEKEVRKEYRQILKALGIGKGFSAERRKQRSELINEAMKKRVSDVNCSKCKSELKQTRKGSKRALCTCCGAKFQLLK